LALQGYLRKRSGRWVEPLLRVARKTGVFNVIRPYVEALAARIAAACVTALTATLYGTQGGWATAMRSGSRMPHVLH